MRESESYNGRINIHAESTMKPEYHKGIEARKNFESTMAKLFRVPKSEVKKPEPKPLPKKESEK